MTDAPTCNAADDGDSERTNPSHAETIHIQGIPYFLLIDKTGVAGVVEARNPETDDLLAARLKE